MGLAKQIIIKPIAAKDANKIVRAVHYSGKVVNNINALACLHALFLVKNAAAKLCVKFFCPVAVFP